MAAWFSRPARRAKGAARCGERRLVVEMLESRLLLTTVVLSDWEQLLVELVNRARSDPPAEAARYGIALNQGLASGTLSSAPKQPLAPHQALIEAARGHSQDMLDRNYFDHESPQGVGAGERIEAAGYSGITWGENIVWVGTTLTLDRDESIYQQHEQLFLSPGHRQNLLHDAFREIGPGVKHGVFSDSGNNFNASMVTQKFGLRSGDPFITGVIYQDTIVQDQFYTIGEGVGNVTVAATEISSGVSFSTQSGPSGGYSLQVPAGTYTVTATGGILDWPITVADIVVGSENRKVDFELSSASPPPPPPPPVTGWQNPNNPLDTNADGEVSPIDALLIINYINQQGAGPLPEPDPALFAPPPYLDTNGDGYVTAVDALLVINLLNNRPEAEGEPPAASHLPNSTTASIFASRDFFLLPAWATQTRPVPRLVAPHAAATELEELLDLLASEITQLGVQRSAPTELADCL